MNLRSRVLVGMALIALVLAGSAWLLTRSTEDRLVGAIDDQLDEAMVPALQANDIRSYVSLGRCAQLAGRVSEASREDSDEASADSDSAGTGVFDDELATTQPEPERLSNLFIGSLSEDGRLETCFAPNVSEETPPPVIPADSAIRAAATGEPFTVGTDGSDLRYRVRTAPSELTGQIVVVAQPLRQVDAAVSRLIDVEVAVTVAILGVMGLVAWWVVHLGVRPLNQMTVTATAIAAGDLSARVPEVGPETEAGRLGRALNQMLGRIEDAFDERTRSEVQLRQFLADASHELRTPVTTIRGYAELYQSGGLEGSRELAEAMRRTGQEAVRMGKLIDDMLLLARLDQGRPLESSPVDVSALVADAARDAGAVDPARPISSSTPEPGTEPLVVLGDSDRLRQVIAKLVGNALVHTEAGAAIEITAQAADGRAVVSVTDHGAGMPPDAVDHAFERFYRADRSRSRHQGGTGLGLAIVAAIVSAHGGTVGLTSVEGQGTKARIELPLAPS
jgi:two-component system OmpR family sensor kinase